MEMLWRFQHDQGITLPARLLPHCWRSAPVRLPEEDAGGNGVCGPVLKELKKNPTAAPRDLNKAKDMAAGILQPPARRWLRCMTTS